MPGRLRPPAAVTVGALSLVTLGVVAGVLYARREPRVQTSAIFPSWATSSCAVVRTDRWSPLPGVEYTGRLEVDLPAASNASLVLFVSDPLPLDLEVLSVAGLPIPYRRERVRVGPGVAVPPDLWLDRGNPWDLPSEAIKATVESSPVGARRLTVRLGRRAPNVLARLEGYPESTRANVCAARLGVHEAFAEVDRVDIEPNQAEWFGTGWSGLDISGAEVVRWMGAHGAILVPSAMDGNVRVRLRAAPGAVVNDDDPPRLWLVVNDVFEATAVAMREAFSTYSWNIPDRAWLAHTNELLFAVSPTGWLTDESTRRPRARGLALSSLELSLEK
jgi:hypothetical protein